MSIASPLFSTTEALAPADARVEILCHTRRELTAAMERLGEYVLRREQVPLSRHPGWLPVLQSAFRHYPYCLEATQGGRTCGALPLAYVRSWLFDRFLVGLPYLNYGGCMADDDRIAGLLV